MTIEAVNMETPVKVEFDNFEHGFPEGFGPGRWGSSDPFLGVPVKWNHISEAKVIVE